jgi:capsid protein
VAGRKGDLQVSDKTEIVRTEPIKLSDIKPGDFLGVTSNKSADGRLTAFEIRRFPRPLNPGHRPFDGRTDQTMTNATVSATVQATSARELTMAYEGGSQKIVVPENASVSDLVPGTVKDLAPGARVNLTAAGEPPVAQRIQVTR